MYITIFEANGYCIFEKDYIIQTNLEFNWILHIDIFGFYSYIYMIEY